MDFGLSTFGPIPDSVQQTERSKTERFRSDFGCKKNNLKAKLHKLGQKKLTHLKSQNDLTF